MTVTSSRESEPTPPTAAEPGAGALLTDEQIRWLRRAVVGMTAVLVAGIALLIGRVIYLARPAATQAGSAAAGAAAQLPLLPEVRLALPAGAVVKGISATGSRLAITHAAPGGSGEEISVLDLTTGKVISHVTIERAK